MLSDPDVDAVVIGTWPHMHHALFTAALEAGKHVLCEARMSMNAAQGREMLAASRARPDLAALIVPSPFTLAMDATLRRALSDGDVGDVRYVSARASVPSPAQVPLAEGVPPTLSWRQDAELSGDNVMQLGILYEALARWLGHATKVQARGKIWDRRPRIPAWDPSGPARHPSVPDCVEVLAELECGAQAHILCQAGAWALAEGEAPSGAWIRGSRGSITVDWDAQTARLRRADGSVRTLYQGAEPFSHDNPPGWRVEEEFVGAVRGAEPVRLCDPATALRYMEFTSAVAESLDTGCSVTVRHLRA